MEVLTSVLPDFFGIFKITYIVMFQYYGWVLFVIGLIYMLYFAYRHEIEHQFIHGIPWTFLQVRVPKNNMLSTLAVENIFAQMHALHTGLTPAQIYIEGRIQGWYSLEIVSFGGQVSFIFRIPTSMRHVVEAAIYSHYPQAEITEVEDYMANFHYDPELPGEYDIWGTEWKLTDPDVFPIRTYKDFEHPSSEQKIVDPLANFFESMGKFEPHEFFATQINIQPLADEEWKPRAELKVKELIGEEIPHKFSLIGFLLTPLTAFANLGHGGGHGHGHKEPGAPKNNWMQLTEGEKERVTLIESKMSKPGYKTKIRQIYIAPKDRFDKSKVGMFPGAYRLLSKVVTNKLKPDLSKTWTAVDYIFSPTLEKPYLDWLLNLKKRNLFKGFKERSILIGSGPFILNIEELATIFHFPITQLDTTVPSHIEKTESKKYQAPVNLPIAE